MNGVVIDERRIKVDFSQSVSKLWFNFKKGQLNAKNKEDQANELMLPNENQKLEIRTNKNFMNDNKNYKLLIDNPESRDYRYAEDYTKYHKDKSSKKHSKKHKFII